MTSFARALWCMPRSLLQTGFSPRTGDRLMERDVEVEVQLPFGMKERLDAALSNSS